MTHDQIMETVEQSCHVIRNVFFNVKHHAEYKNTADLDTLERHIKDAVEEFTEIGSNTIKNIDVLRAKIKPGNSKK